MRRTNTYALFALFALLNCVFQGCEEAEELIQQAEKNVVVENDIVNLTFNKQKFYVHVFSNCDYEIIIPEQDKNWVRLVEDSRTKAINESDVLFAVEENEEYNTRSTTIVFSAGSSNKADTVYVTQDKGINSLVKALRKDNSISLFYQALEMTGMIDSIRGYIDESFVSLKYDQPDRLQSRGNEFLVNNLDTMFIKYTVFCETDDVLRQQYNITTIEQLIEFCKNIYDESFPADANLYNSDYTDRRNPLNRFISYHILPMGVSYDKLNPINEISKERFIKWNEIDFEDFYSPMLQHSVLKVSTPYQSEVRYLNRKGTAESGIEVNPNGIVASNGYAFHISDVLIYSKYVRENVFDTRMRILGSTLFPEMMTNGARERNDAYQVISFNDYYKRSFTMHSEDSYIYLSQFKAYDYKYMGESVYLNYNTDISFKLPSVPTDGLYEIRLSCRSSGGKCYQFYLNNSKYGAPFTLSMPEEWYDWWKEDQYLGDESIINAYDDTLRAHGYMKGVASYAVPSLEMTLRDIYVCYRYIIGSDIYMEANKDYYLRIQGLDNDSYSQGWYCGDLGLEIIEIVPKNVYDGPVREDKN